ncbi:MAG TPA: methionine synthase [Actinomycetes bacterium]
MPEPTAFRPGTGWSTGVGSMPGTDPREAVAVVTGEAPRLPHLPELPGRGPGADLVGRAAALLVDLHVDLQPSGWRLVDRPSGDERRARSFLAQDLDEMESACYGVVGPVKVQVCGPWTLAAALRLTRGEPVLSDPGAVRDLVASLTEGLLSHLSDLRGRMPGAELVLQLDEPSLPAVLAGGVLSSSGARAFRPVPTTTAEDVLRGTVEALRVPVVVHCCADRPPVGLLHRAGVHGLSLDVTVLPRDLGDGLGDELGVAVEAGVALLAGVVPAVRSSATAVSDPAGTVEPLRRLWHRLGLDPEGLRRVVVTPTCGMAGADPGHAVAALRLAAAAASQLADDPEG